MGFLQCEREKLEHAHLQSPKFEGFHHLCDVFLSIRLVLAEGVCFFIMFLFAILGICQTPLTSKATPLMVTNDQLRDWHIAFYFDNRDFTQLGAEFSLITVAFVCVILCIFSVMFSQDAHKLVLHPVEAMISRVDQIRENPLMAMKMADEEFKREEAKKAKTQRKQRELRTVLKDFITCKNQNQQTEVLETVILEKTIIKLGSLLALGFGEAGANIIEQNMHGSDSAAVDAMVLGKACKCDLI